MKSKLKKKYNLSYAVTRSVQLALKILGGENVLVRWCAFQIQNVAEIIHVAGEHFI